MQEQDISLIISSGVGDRVTDIFQYLLIEFTENVGHCLYIPITAVLDSIYFQDFVEFDGRS